MSEMGTRIEGLKGRAAVIAANQAVTDGKEACRRVAEDQLSELRGPKVRGEIEQLIVLLAETSLWRALIGPEAEGLRKEIQALNGDAAKAEKQLTETVRWLGRDEAKGVPEITARIEADENLVPALKARLVAVGAVISKLGK